MMRPTLYGCLALAWAFTLAGCTLVSSPFQDGGVSGYWEDKKIRLMLHELFLLNHPQEAPLYQVEFLVHGGQVLLLGRVKNEKTRQKALDLVKALPGIKNLRQHIEIAPESTLDYAQDALLGRQFQAALLMDPHIFSQNYRVRAVGGIIYILGAARSPRERDLVLAHGNTLKARRIIAYIDLIPSSTTPPKT